MKIGPKYKIARRLGANIFDKTQSAKFALRTQNKKTKGRPKAQTDFGIQMLEKQRVRFFYGLGERQFSKYVKQIIHAGMDNPTESLHQKLESRLDNVVYRMHLAPTRQAGRQMVGHGHIQVNGKKTDIPSFEVSPGDVITVRLGSQKSLLFTNLKEKLKDEIPATWITFDPEKLEAKIIRRPDGIAEKSLFDLSQVLEFYKR